MSTVDATNPIIETYQHVKMNQESGPTLKKYKTVICSSSRRANTHSSRARQYDYGSSDRIS